MPRGRPKTFNRAYIKKIIPVLPDMFADGQSMVEVCAELGMSQDTFSDLVREHEDWSLAYKRGRALSNAWWERLGRQASSGQVPIQATTWIFNMKNRFGWNDGQQQEDDGSVPRLIVETRSKK